MKVPTYTQQVQRTTEVGGQRMSVQASPQQFARGAEAAKAFYAQAEDAAFQYGKAELQQRNETERLKALNESNRMLSESAAMAEEMAKRGNPDEADQYWQDSVTFHREKQSKAIQNDATRQQFFLQYDATSQKQTANVQRFTRSMRASIGTATWLEREESLKLAAASGDMNASVELFGDPANGIKSFYDNGIQNGFISPDKAAARAMTTRTMVAKNRIVNHIDALSSTQPVEVVEKFLADFEQGKVPDNIASELSYLLPTEVKQLKNAIEGEIRTQKQLDKAAKALLSDEQRLELEQYFNNPEVSFEDKKKKLLDVMMGTPDQVGMVSSDFRATISHGKGVISSMKAQINAVVKTIEKQQADATRLLLDGFDPGVATILAPDRQIAALGTQAPASLVQAQNVLKATYDIITGMRKMGPLELAAAVDEMETKAKESGGVTMEAAVVIKNGRQMLSGLSSKIASGDALEAAQNRDLIVSSPLIADMYQRDDRGRAVLVNGRPQVSQEWMQNAARRSRDAYFVADKFGLTTPQFTTDAERSALSDLLKNGDAGSRHALLTSIAQGFGNDAPIVLGELVDAKNVDEYAHLGGLLVDGKHSVVSDALQGLDLIKNGAPVKYDQTTMQEVFNQTVGKSLINNPSSMTAGYELAKGIYAYRAQGLGEFNEEIYAQAIQEAFGQNKSTGKGGFHEMARNNMVLLPDNTDADDVKKLLKNVTDEQFFEVTDGQVVNPGLSEDIREESALYSLVAYGKDQYYLIRGDSFGYHEGITDDFGDPLIINIRAWQELYGK